MIPIKVFTHYSVLNSYNQVPKLLAHASKLGLKALPITDIHSVSGTVEFLNEIKKNKYDIKPIIGCHVRVRETDNSIYYVTLFCKNKTGWYSLIKLLSESDLENEVLSIRKEKLFEHSDGLILVIGGIDSPLLVWKGTTFFEELLSTYKEGFFLLKENLNVPIQGTINDAITAMDLPTLEANPVFYYCPEDRLYQQIIICSRNKVTMKESGSLAETYDNIFFDNANELHLKDSYPSGNQILSDLIETFDLKDKPHLPLAKIPSEFGSADDYLLHLCRQGWKELLAGKFPSKEVEDVYIERIKRELSVFTSSGLSNYILIVYIITNFCHRNNFAVGIRGSGVGSLTSFLIQISDVDSILPDPTLPYHPDRCLLFERFYNDARNTPGNVSLPDIDIDTEISARPHIIKFLKDTYGHDTVSSIITFAKLDGRGAVKEVFRVLEPCENHYEVCNKITRQMVDIAKIQDIIQDIREEDPDYSVVQYNIDNIPEVAHLAEEFPDIFEIAIKLSGTITKQGIHAAGVVIGDKPLGQLFPITRDLKNGNLILALEMEEAEYCGVCKLDLLGVAAYEKVSKILQMINENLDEPVVGLDDGFVEEN